jgi:antitoxin ParD1/3/4
MRPEIFTAVTVFADCGRRACFHSSIHAAKLLRVNPPGDPFRKIFLTRDNYDSVIYGRVGSIRAGAIVMQNTQSLNITLPHEMAKIVKDKVASGAYASESDVIQDGLRALQARDAVIERWLQESVVPVFDRVATGDEKLIDASAVFSGLASRYAARKSKKEEAR